ncbi:hypothetical protein NUSPORA_02471 [Nucleospora cyclopteri]
MMESLHMKTYAVKYFLQHSKLPLEQIARDFVTDVYNKCFINEKVVLKNTNEKEIYKLSKIVKGTDRVILEKNGEMHETTVTNVIRANPLKTEEILIFLTSITKKTPFGVLLIENAIEKISDPNFNLRREETSAVKIPHSYFSSEMAQKRHVPSIGGPASSFSQQQPVKTLNTNDQAVLTVKGFTDKNLDLLIKIFQFFSHYNDVFGTNVKNIDHLGELIKEPEYNSNDVAQMHFSVMKFLEPEIDSFKSKHSTWLLIFVQKLFPKDEKIESALNKKKFTLSIENWKMNVKSLLNNLSCDLEYSNLLVLNGFSKKNAIKYRLELLSFLIDLVCTTETFKEMANSTYNNLKSSKIRYENLQLGKKRLQQQKQGKTENEMEKLMRDSEKLSKDIKELQKKLTTSALRINLGGTRNYYLFLLTDKFCVKDIRAGFYYILDRKGLQNFKMILNLKLKSQKLIDYNLSEAFSYIEGQKKNVVINK